MVTEYFKPFVITTLQGAWKGLYWITKENPRCKPFHTQYQYLFYNPHSSFKPLWYFSQIWMVIFKHHFFTWMKIIILVLCPFYLKAVIWGQKKNIITPMQTEIVPHRLSKAHTKSPYPNEAPSYWGLNLPQSQGFPDSEPDCCGLRDLQAPASAHSLDDIHRQTTTCSQGTGHSFEAQALMKTLRVLG